MDQFLLKRYGLLLLLCGVIFFGGNDIVHLTDPDEAFYSLTTKEMNQRQEWLTPYIFDQPQFEKPILTYWLIKISFIIFGETPFAARFFPALFATFGVLAVYTLGILGFLSEGRAFLAAVIMATSALYIGMGKTVFTDMIFSVLILYSLLSFYLAFYNPAFKRWGILAFFAFAGFAVLAKGPLGLVIPAAIVAIFLLYRRSFEFLRTSWVLAGFLLCLLIAVPWYWYEIHRYGQAFIHEFFYNDHWRRVIEAEHKRSDSWYFYPLTMLWGLFPWSLFLAAAFVDLFKRLKYSAKPFEHFLLSWILIVFIVFQVAHSKLSSYILPMFPALALLTANYIDECLQRHHSGIIKKLSYVLIVFLALLGVGCVAAHKAYQAYLPTLYPAYWLSAGLLSISGISLALLLKDKVKEALWVLSASLAPILATALLVSSDLEPHIAMHDASCYVPSLAMNKTTILVSKPYARGVRYHTGQDVAAMDINGNNYFSPHPIPILNTDEKLLTFLKSQTQTFAILRRSGYEHLKDNYSKQFDVKILKRSGRNYVLKIEPMKAS